MTPGIVLVINECARLNTRKPIFLHTLSSSASVPRFIAGYVRAKGSHTFVLGYLYTQFDKLDGKP